ncbi:MAG: hypothetical protein ACLVAH_06205 [Anaeromassilibacillus sp.]
MFDSSILRYGKLVMPATVKASACSCRTSPVERRANSLQSAFVGTRKALCVHRARAQANTAQLRLDHR